MRKIIIKNRGEGKTTELIKLAAQESAYIVCGSHESAENIAYIASERNLQIPFPITHREFLEKKYYARGIKGFLFDDIDCFVQNLSNVPILAMTATRRDYHDKNDDTFTLKCEQEEFVLTFGQSPRGLRCGENRPNKIVIDCYKEMDLAEFDKYLGWLNELRFAMR